MTTTVPVLEEEEARVAAAAKPSRSFSVSEMVSKGGTILSLALLVGLFSMLRPETFFTVSNAQVVLSQAAVLGMIAGGLTIVLVLGEFDLSIAFVAALSGVLSSHLLGSGASVGVAIGVAMAVSIAIGLFNGFVVAYLGVNAFIATLGSGAVVQGLALWITSGGSAQLVPPSMTQFLWLGQGEVLGLAVPVLLSAVLLVVLWVFLNKTEAGRRVDATGGNREAARLSGISVRRYLLSGFVISASCAGFAGIVLASTLGGGYTNAADAFLLQGFTACFLGAVTLRNSEFHVVGTAVGVIILAVTFSGLSQLNVEAFWQNIAQGGILIIAVALTVVADRLQQWLAARQQRRVLDAESQLVTP